MHEAPFDTNSKFPFHLKTATLIRPIYSVRLRLFLLVLACVVPAAGMVIALIIDHYQRDLQQSRINTIGTARALAVAVDQHVIGVQATLTALASSDLIASGDFATFHSYAKDVQINNRAATIMLVQKDGHQLINTAVPYGQSLPSTAIPQILESTNQGEVGYADLFTSNVKNKRLVAVGVPVFLGGQVIGALTAPVSPDQLKELLQQQKLPPNWTAVLTDRRGTVIARSRDHDKFLGASLPETFRKRTQQVDEDWLESVTLDGMPVVAGFSHSPLTQWTVAIGVPTAEFGARLNASLLKLLVGITLLLTASLTLAWFYAARITRTIHALTAQAAALGRGENLTPISPKAIDFREAQQLADAIEQASVELRQSNSALVQRNTDLQQFAFVASHDLRTPLNSVAGYLTLLKKRYGAAMDPNALALLQRTTSSLTLMDQLTHDLLAYAQLDATAPSHSLVDCEAVLQDALVLLDAAISDTRARIDVGPMPLVRADRSQLVLLFENLLGNALKYTDGQTPDVRVRAVREGGEWIFSVTDKGIGIDAQHHTRIFGFFKRLHTQQEYPGNGVGLAACLRIVERHGGRLWVQSEPGMGSTFFFTLPDALDTKETHA